MAEDFTRALSVGDALNIEYAVEQEKHTLKSMVVEVVNGTKIIIACPSISGRLVLLSPGERFPMYHLNPETGVYRFTGLIVSREKIDDQVRLHVLRVSEIQRAQRREYFRLSLVADGVLEIPDGEGEEVFIHNGQQIKEVVPVFRKSPVIIKDLSAGGARVHAKESFRLGETMSLKFELENAKYHLECEIVRCFPIEDVVKRYDLGIKFINIDPNLQRKLLGVIFERQRKLLKKGLSL